MVLTEREEALKAAYIAKRGYWRPWTEALLRINPGFLDTYARYAGHPAETGPLSPALCELIYVALDGSATHLFASGLKLHMRFALERGATAAQIVEVLQLATAQGLAGCTAGVDILAEELEAAGLAGDLFRAPLSERQVRLRAAYEDRFGDWPASCDRLLRLDPDYFALMAELLVAAPSGGLDEKSRCLISVALHACFTGHAPQALQLCIRRALRLGATAAEILQVLQMTAHLGVHACSVGIPLLAELGAGASEG